MYVCDWTEQCDVFYVPINSGTPVYGNYIGICY